VCSGVNVAGSRCNFTTPKSTSSGASCYVDGSVGQMSETIFDLCVDTGQAICQATCSATTSINTSIFQISYLLTCRPVMRFTAACTRFHPFRIRICGDFWISSRLGDFAESSLLTLTSGSITDLGGHKFRSKQSSTARLTRTELCARASRRAKPSLEAVEYTRGVCPFQGEENCRLRILCCYYYDSARVSTLK
jgi:hypothetical protein